MLLITGRKEIHERKMKCSWGWLVHIIEHTVFIARRKENRERRRRRWKKRGKNCIFIPQMRRVRRFLLNSLSKKSIHGAKCSAIFLYSFSSSSVGIARRYEEGKWGKENILKISQIYTRRIIFTLRDFFLCSISLIEALINFCVLFWTTFHSLRDVFTSHQAIYRELSFERWQ